MKKNTKDYTVTNCGSWPLHKYTILKCLSAFHIGAFFNKRARDTSHAKASLGAFPPVFFAPRNNALKLAVDFTIASCLFSHSAIYKCSDDFNRTNGTVATLQSGMTMYMAKAIILAIYCDHPAARKCCLCGSSCPQCFARQPDFAKPPIGGTMLMRTPGNIEVKKQVCIYIRLWMRELLCVLMYVLMCVLMYVCFNVPFDVRLDVCLDVWLDLCLHASLHVILMFVLMC